MENAKTCIEEALDSLNICTESGKIILKEKQERAVKELIVLCWVTGPFCRFTRVYEGHFLLCYYKEEFKAE